MDYQQYQEDPNFSNDWDEKPLRQNRSKMEIAAFILALCSVLFLSFFPLTIILISLSVLFALLSKDDRMKTSRLAKTSIIISVIAFLFGTFYTVSYVSQNRDMILNRIYDIWNDLEYDYEYYSFDEDFSPFSYMDPDQDRNPYRDSISDIYGDSPLPSEFFSQQPSDPI